MYPWANQHTKTWKYPDGTVSTGEPVDGQIFFESNMQIGNPVRSWQWNARRQQWLDITYNKQPQDEVLDIKFEIASASQCECGSEKVGSNKHSNWCRKFDSIT